jgi:hypothetical protein
LAIIDLSKISDLNMGMRFSGPGREQLPKERRDALSQIETAVVFLQVHVYSAFLVSLGMLAGGIGLILHMTWGRVVAFIAGGLAALSFFCLVLFAILLSTVSVGGQSVPMPSNFWVGFVLRLAALLGPMVFVSIVVMNSRHTRFLRTKL